MENRAAVFTSSSQDVEVHQAGAWWSGSLLGWRHEPDGSCQVWVRAVVAGIERTAWTDLVDVRLPERPTLHSVPPVAVHGSADSQQDALTSTISLFAVRDGAPQDVAGPATVVGGHRPGGRRRAPEAPDVPARGALRTEPSATSPGRHRAPAAEDAVVPGRHRAADTGVFPAVPAERPVDRTEDRTAERAAVPARPRRTDDAWGSAESTGRLVPVLPEPGGPADDSEFFTRPLRLATSVPHQRSSSWED
jgi:hypothetical protein